MIQAPALLLSAAMFASPVMAQDVPADLSTMPPVSTAFDPPRTSWGDPDFRGTWPIDNIARIPFERLPEHGDRFWLNAEEAAALRAQEAVPDERYAAEDAAGRLGAGAFITADRSGRRTSLLVSPADGHLPALTAYGAERYQAGRSSWTDGVVFESTADFDTFDRCITRGFPATMMPHRYNNGQRVMQAPGQVVIMTEMVHEARVIELVDPGEVAARRWPDGVRTWLGQSLGWWEGKVLVIETTNIAVGDSVSADPLARGPSPLNLATHGREPWNILPTSPQARVIERLTMTGPDSLTYEVTYSDPQVFTAPWTARLDWTRDEDYELFEYACHEGNVQIRNYITASRAERAAAAETRP